MNQPFLPKSGKQIYLFLLNKSKQKVLVTTGATAIVAEQALRAIQQART